MKEAMLSSFYRGASFFCSVSCLHSPADDGGGVDLDGLLALTSREQIISLLLHILTTLYVL
jgi:hypothetical protein